MILSLKDFISLCSLPAHMQDRQLRSQCPHQLILRPFHTSQKCCTLLLSVYLRAVQRYGFHTPDTTELCVPDIDASTNGGTHCVRHECRFPLGNAIPGRKYAHHQRNIGIHARDVYTNCTDCSDSDAGLRYTRFSVGLCPSVRYMSTIDELIKGFRNGSMKSEREL